MTLKQSIVIVNEFTFKPTQKSRGTRGGTPGDYVLRYMARDKATEDLTPVRVTETEDYITRYMAREDAVETLDNVPEIKHKMRKAQKNGGVAFGYGSVSLSHDKLMECAKDIQNNFDNGKTILKTVLSFDEEYLKENGIVDEDFELKNSGDYRGNIDQMKLRMAIMNGLDRLGRRYDDLQYIGVIQVDTKHVHCHLAMVDRGIGRLMHDGTQRGKLSEEDKVQIRRGIDMFLDEEQKIQQMTSNIGYDRRNAVCFIKKFTHRTMDSHGLPQFLIACLPDDKSLWRANTNRKEMRKANTITREYVTQLLNEDNSGYKTAMRNIERYASDRQKNEGLDNKQYKELIDNGRERLISDCMNSVYSILKDIPDSELNVRTPMLSAMSLDYENMASRLDEDPMVEFGFRLRSYGSRLNHHKKEREKYRKLVKQYEASENPSEDSKVLYDFFKIEEDYNNKCMTKYQYFLNFLPMKEDYEDDFNDLISYRSKVRNMNRMIHDKNMQRMRPENAEEYGVKTYDMKGGQYVVTNVDLLENRLKNMNKTYKTKVDDFKFKLAGLGLTFDGRGVINSKEYSFDEVKALDIHHLAYDWVYDQQVSDKNAKEFLKATTIRTDALDKAVEYLTNTEQEHMIDSLPVKDCDIMSQVAARVAKSHNIQVAKPTRSKKYPGKTVSLDKDYNKLIKNTVSETIHSINIEDDFVDIA